MTSYPMHQHISLPYMGEIHNIVVIIFITFIIIIKIKARHEWKNTECYKKTGEQKVEWRTRNWHGEVNWCVSVKWIMFGAWWAGAAYMAISWTAVVGELNFNEQLRQERRVAKNVKNCNAVTVVPDTAAMDQAHFVPGHRRQSLE